MRSSFKDNFNYIVAFVAVLVGLSAFKEAATSNSINILTLQLNYLQLSIPFIASMLLATYVGALAMFSKNINFTLFPLTRYLERVSYFFASIGLLYPLLVLIAWLATFLIYLPIDKGLTYTLQALTSLLGALIAFLAERITSSKLHLNVEREAAYIRSITEESKRKSSTEAFSREALFLKNYEEASESSRALLRLMGYGVAVESLGRTAQTLADKNILSKEDLHMIRQIAKARNRYAHTGESPSAKEIDSMLEELNRLQKKIDSEAYRLSE